MSTSLIKFLGLYLVALSFLSVPSQGATVSCRDEAKGTPTVFTFSDDYLKKLGDVPDQDSEDKAFAKRKKIKIKHNFESKLSLDIKGCVFIASGQITPEIANCDNVSECGKNAGNGGPSATNTGNYRHAIDLDSELESNGGNVVKSIKTHLEVIKKTAQNYQVNADPECQAPSESSTWDLCFAKALRKREHDEKNQASAPPPPVQPPVAAAPAPAPVQPPEELDLPAINDSCKRFNDSGPAGGKKTELCELANQCIASKAFSQTCSCDTSKACLGSYTAFCDQAKKVGNAVCNVGTSFAGISAPSTHSTAAMTPALSAAIADTQQKLSDFKKLLGTDSDVMNCGLYRVVNKNANSPTTCDPKAPYRASLKRLESWLNDPSGLHAPGTAAYYKGVYNELSNESAADFFQLNGIKPAPELQGIYNADYKALVASTKTLATNGFFDFITQPKASTQVTTSSLSDSGFVDPMGIINRLNNSGSTVLGCLAQPDSKLSSANSKLYLDAIIHDAKRVKNLNDWIQYRCNGVRPPDAKGPWIPNKSTN